MFLLQVIIFTYLCQSCHSKSIYSDDATDLGSGVLFSWELDANTNTLKMSVKLPDSFRWIAVGFQNIPVRHKYWEDIALISIEEELGSEVSYLKTIHLDEDANVYESKIDLYEWELRGRKKVKEFYYFTIKRNVYHIETESPVTLVWAYGKESGFREYPDANQFKYAPLTLSDPESLKIDASHTNQNQASVNTPTESVDGANLDIDVSKNKQAKLLKEVLPDKQVSKQTNDELNDTEAVPKESKNENVDEANSDSKKTDDFEESKENVGTQNTDSVVSPVPHTEGSEGENGDVIPIIPTESESEKNNQSDDLPEPVDVKIVSEIAETAVDHLEPNTTTNEGEWRVEGESVTVKPHTQLDTDATSTNVSEDEVKNERATVSESIIKNEEIEAPNVVAMQTDQSSETVPTLEEHGKCEIDPCSYSHCPHGTTCFPNYKHCTSTCGRGENATETASSTKCNCVQQKHSWYDVFKNNENTVYFGVIGFSAFFTGLIVLCLACCCANKARKIPRPRKSKVSFYKVNDFDSSADEEIEFLKDDDGDDADMTAYTKSVS